MVHALNCTGKAKFVKEMRAFYPPMTPICTDGCDAQMPCKARPSRAGKKTTDFADCTDSLCASVLLCGLCVSPGALGVFLGVLGVTERRLTQMKADARGWGIFCRGEALPRPIFIHRWHRFAPRDKKERKRKNYALRMKKKRNRLIKRLNDQTTSRLNHETTDCTDFLCASVPLCLCAPLRLCVSPGALGITERRWAQTGNYFCRSRRRASNRRMRAWRSRLRG